MNGVTESYDSEEFDDVIIRSYMHIFLGSGERVYPKIPIFYISLHFREKARMQTRRYILNLPQQAVIFL
jgi:hypothetical protein